jgi:hypothetical protein
MASISRRSGAVDRRPMMVDHFGQSSYLLRNWFTPTS